MMPLGRRTAVYESGLGRWTGIYTIVEGAPSRAAAEVAVAAFTTPYAAGWRDGLADMLTLWLERARAGVTWKTEQVTDWLRELASRLAPGVPKAE